MRIADILAEARGRTIIVGENHTDRAGLHTTLALIRYRHDANYRKLGIEVSTEGKGSYRGLNDEAAALLKMAPDEPLAEEDEHSYMDPDSFGQKLRMNRHWQIRLAMSLCWKIVPIDPYHWNWMSQTEFSYIRSREPAMADAIRQNGPMIAVCGYGHMMGLHSLLGDECVYTMCTKAKIEDAGEQEFWLERIRFAMQLPIIET